jgi:hypothetical protein
MPQCLPENCSPEGVIHLYVIDNIWYGRERAEIEGAEAQAKVLLGKWLAKP